jgi:hypothetical protein
MTTEIHIVNFILYIPHPTVAESSQWYLTEYITEQSYKHNLFPSFLSIVTYTYCLKNMH